jgi:RNA polymerase sigma-70 factor (ECF subfamily)
VRERSRRRPNGDLPLTDEIASWRSDERRLDLEHAIRALPPGYREVVVLHDIEGYTHDEIAALLGIETGTSKSQLFRARRTLRERLCSVRLQPDPR